MTSSSSLYGSTPQTGNINSSNLTTLYSGNQSVVPNGNLVVPGTLTVNGCAILTNCNAFSLLPTNAETILFGGAATTMNIGAGTGVTTINNQLATANYTFPVADGVSGQVLVTDGAGTISFAAASTVGKTYSINASATTGGADFNLVSSDPTTDTIKFANGTGVTVTRTDADTITFAIGQDVATTANPVFAGVTGGNVTVGVVENNTIATTTGNLIIGDGSQNTYWPVINSAAATPVTVQRFSSTTNSPVRSLALNAQSTGTPAVGFGNTLEYQVETAVGNTEAAGYVSVVSTDLTAGSEDFRMNFGLMQNGATYANRLSLFSNGDLNMYNGGTFGILGLTSGFTKLVAPATGSNLTYVLPGAAGTANTVLTNDGSGNLSWALPGGGGSTFGNITIAVDTDNTISTTTGDLVLDSASGTIEMIGIVDINGDYINLNSDNTAVDSAIRFNAGAEILYNYANSRFDISKGINVDNGVLFVDATNNRVGINNTSPQYELHIDQGADGFTQLGMTTAERSMVLTMNDGDDLLTLNYSGADRLQFDTVNQWFVSGNTGINTVTPAYDLDVAGDGRFTQTVITDGALKINGSSSGYSNFIAPTTGSNLNYTLPGTAGAANTVLTNDGSGVLSWALPGGGGSTFGNVTVGVATDNTISTTTGNLVLASATNVIDALTATINADALSVDSRATIASSSLTTTSTSTVLLMDTTRNVMTGLVNIIQGANVHCVNFTALRVDATTALLTTFGEMYNTTSLASFTADVSGSDLRLLVTPTSATSTTFSCVRTSLD